MARNKVQFQKGLSEAEFSMRYGTEDLCHVAPVGWRWPNGFVCPDCGRTAHCIVQRGARRLFQCNACRKQTTVRAGTIFASSKLPLTTWFRAMYLITQSKKGISSIELGRRLGVTQTSAWLMKHKLMQVMLERNGGARLKGRVEMDDAYIGGERPGRRGRGAAGKTPFVAAVETTDDGKPHRVILRRVDGFRSRAVAGLAKKALTPRTRKSSRMVLPAFAPLPGPAASTPPSSPAPAERPRDRRLSPGSTPSSATSRPPSSAPTGPSETNTCPAISPNSSIGSIVATTSPP
jgi:transposase-like protein